jgi:hypothetical protein
MKKCSRNRLFAAVLAVAFGATWATSAINVTYHVDMSVQKTIGTFNPPTDNVFISGNFSNPDWQSGATTVATNYILTPNGVDPDIYEGTFAIDVATGGWENHQFVINPNNAFIAPQLKWEGAVGNRFFQVPNTDTNLPVVFWNNVTNATVVVVTPVTFQLDMSVQTALGNFDTNTDFVMVAGDWNWDEGTAVELVNDGSNVWGTTMNITNAVGTTINYKFIMGTFASGIIWETDGVGPGGAQNRQFVLGSTSQTLPVECFNNLCSLPSVFPVTFQVNMAAQMAYGNFVDGVNTVTAAGSFNNWDAVSFVLTNDPGEPMVYKGTTSVAAAAGAPVAWQYVIDAASWEEAVGNRTFAMATNSQTLPMVFWNNVNDLGPVTTTLAGGNQMNVLWNPGVLVGLQKSTGLPNGWVNVPSTTGQSNAMVTITADKTYFRLIGPVTP